MPGSIQQLHYEMANNLMKAMEVKLRKTYITGETQEKTVDDADAEDKS